MILKHRDREVLRFDWAEPFGVKNVELDPAAERFLPLAFRKKVRRDPSALRYELELWLLNRTPPMSRTGIREALRYLGFDADAPDWKRNLITFGRGLSLNDVHWVVKDDSSEKWASSNLYDDRLVVSQYFLRNRIEKIIQYREKADSYIKIRSNNDTINPNIPDKMLKRAAEPDDLDRKLKETLKSFPKAKTEKLAILFKTTTRTIARHLKALQAAGELKRIGSRKTGYWQVV